MIRIEYLGDLKNLFEERKFMENMVLLDEAQKEINGKLSKYKGRKVSELKIELGMPSKDNKASFVRLARKMLGLTNNQFTLCDNRVNAVLKTVRLTGMEEPAEAMSFMPVDFNHWSTVNNWQESSLYQYFNERFLVFFIFQQYPSGKRVNDDEITFLDVRIWKMPEYDLNHGLKEVWQRVHSLINENELEIVKCTQKNGVIVNKNNLPKSTFNYLGHLRPGAKNGEDKTMLPTGQSIVKQRFWFNQDYVKEIIGL